MKVRMLPLAVLVLVFADADATRAQDVLVNQAGYLPDQVKFAYFAQPDDSFHVIDKATGEARYGGPLVLAKTNDPATGMTLYRGDFSPLTQEGYYQISTSSAKTSIIFPVSRIAYEGVYQKSLKGFYYQRCGGILRTPHAGAYARPLCHNNDGVFHSSTGRAGSARVVAGWHDAGDYGKYVVNAGITVGTLLFGYQLFPSRFAYDDLNIPESGNGVPDILDEVRYELEWLLTMQDSADGAAYFKVTTANFDGFEMPHQDLMTRYIYEKSSTATGDFAAVMAQAARLYAPFDTAFAGRCLAAARHAWEFLQAHPNIVPTGGFHNPAGTGTGEYGDANDSDERLWAAAELFETTGESAYRTFFENHYNESGLITYAMGWQNVRTFAQIAYLFGKQTGASVTVKSQLRNALNSYCSSLSATSASDGLNVTLSLGDYYWGSNSVALNNAILLICGYEQTGTQQYYVTALQQLNYVLGCNSHAMSFVTGVGVRYPMYPHHRPSGADGIAEPVPGLLAGGPDRYLDDEVLRAHFTSSTPPARCYIDDVGSYASNEICINWNAPLVFVSGYLNESPLVTVGGEKLDLPQRLELQQNYPNPFNPRTEIGYSVPTASGRAGPQNADRASSPASGGRDLVSIGGRGGQVPGVSEVKLTVHDLLGREVAVLVNEKKLSGSYQVTFDGTGLASGMYIYRLRVGAFVESRTMLLLR
ncbi:MAG: Cellodextrinase [Bacteroidetes bacterium]|nr:Cellodextrinase [Bacteroidota bacterium]